MALVSDAGTPLVSDPGARLVSEAIQAGYDVVCVPGASAPLAALVSSGLPAERFTFVGFLPRKKGEQQALLASLANREETLVFFESPRRAAATLLRLADVFGERSACVARELTKLHEEIVRGTLSELAERFADGTRGELTLVVEGAAGGPAEVSAEQLDAAIREGIAAQRGSRELAAELSKLHGQPRRQLYARILALRNER